MQCWNEQEQDAAEEARHWLILQFFDVFLLHLTGRSSHICICTSLLSEAAAQLQQVGFTGLKGARNPSAMPFWSLSSLKEEEK